MTITDSADQFFNVICSFADENNHDLLCIDEAGQVGRISRLEVFVRRLLSWIGIGFKAENVDKKKVCERLLQKIKKNCTWLAGKGSEALYQFSCGMQRLSHRLAKHLLPDFYSLHSETEWTKHGEASDIQNKFEEIFREFESNLSQIRGGRLQKAAYRRLLGAPSRAESQQQLAFLTLEQLQALATLNAEDL